VILGTATNVKRSLCLTGVYISFHKDEMNPLIYGIKWDKVVAYPTFNFKQGSLVIDIAHSFDKAKLTCFNEKMTTFIYQTWLHYK